MYIYPIGCPNYNTACPYSDMGTGPPLSTELKDYNLKR